MQEILIRNTFLCRRKRSNTFKTLLSHRSRGILYVFPPLSPSPCPSSCSSYRNSLGATSLPVPCFLPLPFWVSIQLQLSSLNCGTNRKKKKTETRKKKRGNSLGCQVPIVGFTFGPGPDKLKCPRTIPGVDFLFMCPLALSRSPLSSAYLAVFLSVFTSFFLLFLPPVLRSCSASGKPLN